MATSAAQISEQAATTGRKQSIDRQDLIEAALRLLGPHRSVSTLSLREVAREAGIAPNSFYRHFRDIDELAIALIDLAGASLRRIIREARMRVSAGNEVIRPSVQTFMEQLESDAKLLHILLREGSTGSDEFKQAVDRELHAFEEELSGDLVRLAAMDGLTLYRPELAAKAITRLVFALGGAALDASVDERREISEQMIEMVRMIVIGAGALGRGDLGGQVGEGTATAA